jgi:hypothetical protein
MRCFKLALLWLLLTGPLLASCGAGTLVPQGHTLVAETHGRSETSQPDATKIPGFYFYIGNTKPGANVFEYGRYAAGNDQPLRRVRSMGAFFGADRKGLMYSYFSKNPAACSPCTVNVQNAEGVLQYSVTLPQGPAGVNDTPVLQFVDGDGSIYYMTSSCSLIVQLPPGAKGPYAKPVRTIVLPSKACNPKTQRPYYRIFAADSGVIYFHAPYGPRLGAWYIWSPNAKGRMKPERTIIAGDTGAGVYGVDSRGNAWTLLVGNTSLAGYYGPNANGTAQQPTIVPLAGVVQPESMVVASNNQIIYEGHLGTGTGPCVVKIAPPFGGKPVRTLKLPSTFIGYELRSVTF